MSTSTAEPSTSTPSSAKGKGKSRATKPRETTPSPREITPPSRETIPAPREAIPAPRESAPPRRESAPPPRETIPPPRESVPPPREAIPAPRGSAPPPRPDTSATQQANLVQEYNRKAAGILDKNKELFAKNIELITKNTELNTRVKNLAQENAELMAALAVEREKNLIKGKAKGEKERKKPRQRVLPIINLLENHPGYLKNLPTEVTQNILDGCGSQDRHELTARLHGAKNCTRQSNFIRIITYLAYEGLFDGAEADQIVTVFEQMPIFIFVLLEKASLAKAMTALGITELRAYLVEINQGRNLKVYRLIEPFTSFVKKFGGAGNREELASLLEFMKTPPPEPLPLPPPPAGAVPMQIVSAAGAVPMQIVSTAGREFAESEFGTYEPLNPMDYTWTA
jgi:hypothetical protein